MNKIDYVVKLLLIGDSGIGKSALVYKYCEDSFTPSFISTIGIDFKVKNITVQSKHIKLQIWDTAGQERFRSITSAYYRGAHAAIICYDITSHSSFEHVETWINDIRSKTNSIELLLTIVACKCDLESARVITETQGREMALKFKAQFYETSSKNNIGITEMFYYVTDRVLHEKILAERKAIVALEALDETEETRKVNHNKCCN